MRGLCDTNNHANVSRQFATVWRIDSQTNRELVTSQWDRGLSEANE